MGHRTGSTATGCSGAGERRNSPSRPEGQEGLQSFQLPGTPVSVLRSALVRARLVIAGLKLLPTLNAELVALEKPADEPFEWVHARERTPTTG